ncbi:MAG: M48 family metallopeptidase [Alphaproteobacteria bacterium]|nr:M48 family metallopeptidase [Alphaproteobacteria bacterium]
MSLRLDPAARGVVLTLPQRTAEREGLDFVHDHAGWIATRVATWPPRRRFADGVVIPLRGVDHRIVHLPLARRGVWCEDGEIRVAGDGSHLPRRVADWLKREARRELADRAREKAARLGRPVIRVTVRDTRSQWGSCAANGQLSFSWRLVLAPDHILDYVVAHEVAHLAEPNHGARFHDLVADLTTDPKTAEKWLLRHGEKLHCYG